MIPIFLTNLVLPFALSVIRSYLYNSSSAHDSKILDIVKYSVQYLAFKDNNTVDFRDLSNISESHYIGECEVLS